MRSVSDAPERAAELERLADEWRGCAKCALASSRTQVVVGTGDPDADLMFVGEAPGFHEDQQGVPFVVQAGKPLDELLRGIGLTRADVFVANVLKCRPPGNRDPTGPEKEACTPWLERQIALADPKVIVPLGKHAANFLLGLAPETPMASTRGRVHVRNGRTLVPTFHPAYLLRSPGEKKECWKDIQVAMGVLGIETPKARPSTGGNPST